MQCKVDPNRDGKEVNGGKAQRGAHDYAQHVSVQRQNYLFSRFSAAERRECAETCFALQSACI